MKHIKILILVLFTFSSFVITSCKKADFKDIIEKVRDDKDKGDKDKDRGDKDKGDKDKGDKDKDRGDKDKGD
ncbi:MAG: hypothetical protein VW147_08335, partial [Bacteroidota bacterium]